VDISKSESERYLVVRNRARLKVPVRSESAPLSYPPSIHDKNRVSRCEKRFFGSNHGFMFVGHKRKLKVAVVILFDELVAKPKILQDKVTRQEEAKCPSLIYYKTLLKSLALPSFLTFQNDRSKSVSAFPT
jgi:hypothetical protein